MLKHERYYLILKNCSCLWEELKQNDSSRSKYTKGYFNTNGI